MDERVMKYIPKKILPHIVDCSKDSDGYWAGCERGWHFAATDCHTAHGNTVAEFKADIRSITQVDYDSDWD